jgi:hypothetical protein
MAMSASRTKKRVVAATEPEASNVIALPTAKNKVAEAISVEEPLGDLDLLVDGRRVVVEATREIVLRCGKASITLTRAGKIILRGTHVVSRSSGANRVQGSQVKIN